MTATAAEIVARYASRWSIEVCFHDGKNITGVGETQNRVEKAVQRSVPFTFMAQTITVLWYTINANPETQIADRRSGPYPLRWTPDEIAAVPEHRRLTDGFDPKELHR
jgi:hypothetical protein